MKMVAPFVSHCTALTHRSSARDRAARPVTNRTLPRRVTAHHTVGARTTGRRHQNILDLEGHPLAGHPRRWTIGQIHLRQLPGLRRSVRRCRGSSAAPRRRAHGLRPDLHRAVRGPATVQRRPFSPRSSTTSGSVRKPAAPAAAIPHRPAPPGTGGHERLVGDLNARSRLKSLRFTQPCGVAVPSSSRADHSPAGPCRRRRRVGGAGRPCIDDLSGMADHHQPVSPSSTGLRHPRTFLATTATPVADALGRRCPGL